MKFRAVLHRIASVLGGAVVMGVVTFAAPAGGAQPDEGKPLRIGIIGTGNIGGALARHWARAGHELMISSRHPDQLQEMAKALGPKTRVGTPREAAAFGDVVIVSIPYGSMPQLGQDLQAELKGKIVLDTGNPYPSRDGPMAEEARRKGTGVMSPQFLPGTRLVRAFNAINARPLTTESNRSGERYAIPLAGDDAQALKVAERLVRDAGFDPVVVGGLARAKDFDVGTPVYVKLLTAKQLRKALNLTP